MVAPIWDAGQSRSSLTRYTLAADTGQIKIDRSTMLWSLVKVLRTAGFYKQMVEVCILMPDLLISGPAGAGKTQQARGIIDDGGAPVVAADFQSLLAALLLLERQPDGRYPERLRMQAYALPMAEYLRQTIITLAARNGVDVVVTNSDGQGARRKTLLDALRPGAA